MKRLTITLERGDNGEGWTAFVDDGTDKDGVAYGPEIDANGVLSRIAADLDHVDLQEFVEAHDNGDLADRVAVQQYADRRDVERVAGVAGGLRLR